MRKPVYFLLTLLLLSALSFSACRGEQSTPLGTVEAFLGSARTGDWDKAMPLVDFDAKSQRMFGRIYREATPEEQARTQAIIKERLKQSTQKLLANQFPNSNGDMEAKQIDDRIAEVRQTGKNVTLIYRMNRFKDGWRIVDRTHEIDGKRPDTKTQLWAIHKHVRDELGREPTMADINERLDVLLDRLRVRTYQVVPKPETP